MTDIGRIRTTNQDYVYACDDEVGPLPNLFAVADGMGGHKAGDFASRFTVEHLQTQIESLPGDQTDPVRILDASIRQVNRELFRATGQHEELEGAGTTLVCATLAQGLMYVANIGDSRCYVIHDSSTRDREGEYSIEQITEDHSLVEMMVKNGEIDRDEARHHPNKNVITRAVGAAEDVKADFFEVHLLPTDTVLLCTDGLTNMLEDSEILGIVHDNGGVLTLTAGDLIKSANYHGGRDNIGVVIIKP